MKKNLILVGNKVPNKDIASIVDTYDYVLRINRMNNLGITGFKINGIYLEANNHFKNIMKGGENKEHIKQAKNVFMNQNWYNRFTEWEEYLTKEQYKNVEIVNDDFAVKDIGFFNVTSSMRLLAHLLNTDEWYNNFDITVTCLDIENRAEFILKNNEFTWHHTAAKAEQDYLLQLLENNKIQRLYDE